MALQARVTVESFRTRSRLPVLRTEMDGGTGNHDTRGWFIVVVLEFALLVFPIDLGILILEGLQSQFVR